MISITGASGQLGRQIVSALIQRGFGSAIVAGTRNPEKIGDLAEGGIRTVTADFDRPETMRTAFSGADVALIICGTAPVEARVKQHRAAIDAASDAGVGRVVYTSFINPKRESLFPYAAVHEDSEHYLMDSGVPYTILRNNHFVENLDNALMGAWKTGSLTLPGASGKVGYIFRRDVAEATATVLTQPGHANRTYELTGPEALDLHEIAGLASQVWGRPVTASELDCVDYGRILAERGLPPFAVKAQIGIRLASGAGEYDLLSPQAALFAGRSLARVADHLAAFRAKQNKRGE
ncbi:SDR family oxidoreductase [Pelagibacterium sp.]|uniref:SDR family oxidoreductase n=1 Tax=Pelagibacterium sp. TaxID=1967288 RepID=UPI003BABCE28